MHKHFILHILRLSVEPPGVWGGGGVGVGVKRTIRVFVFSLKNEKKRKKQRNETAQALDLMTLRHSEANNTLFTGNPPPIHSCGVAGGQII